MSARTKLPLGLLIVAAFLAPIGGGQLSLDSQFQAISSFGEAFKSVFGSIEAPLLGHAVVGTLCCLALALLLATRKVIQVPGNTMSALLIVLLFILLGTCLYSDFPFYSMITATEWLSYGVAFYAVVAGIGRTRGPEFALGAIAASCALLAALGILEYGQSPPNWRIFSLWNNPNALAAILLLGFFCSAGLTVSKKGTTALAAGAASLLIGTGIVLTQSKGGLLAFAVGLVALLVLTAWWGGTDRRASLTKAAGVVAVLVLMTAAIQFKATSIAPGAGIARISDAEGTSEQSGGFRLNLWKTAVELTKEQPVGYGIGTFRFESARPGITTQTQLAHNHYLQLMSEASPVALLLFLGAAAFWFHRTLRGSQKLPAEQNLLRAGVIAAIVALGAHGFIDSDLYYYGVGITAFMLLGVGLLLSGDAVAPENMPKAARYAAAGGSVALMMILFYFGVNDAKKAMFRGALAAGDATVALAAKSDLKSFAPKDPEVWSLSARAAQSRSEAIADQQRAANLAPSTRNLRLLARMQIDANALPQALTTLQKALQFDPRNPALLLMLSKVQEAQGLQQESIATLERMIATETTPYFQIRALPEIVPTETAEARAMLAKGSTDPKAVVDLLAPAVDIYRQYLQLTVPRVVSADKAQPGASYAGESLERAKQKMADAAMVANELEAAYREVGDEAGASTAAEAAGAFRSAF